MVDGPFRGIVLRVVAADSGAGYRGRSQYVTLTSPLALEYRKLLTRHPAFFRKNLDFRKIILG
jgi:hypothetical protein